MEEWKLLFECPLERKNKRFRCQKIGFPSDLTCRLHISVGWVFFTLVHAEYWHNKTQYAYHTSLCLLSSCANSINPSSSYNFQSYRQSPTGMSVGDRVSLSSANKILVNGNSAGNVRSERTRSSPHIAVKDWEVTYLLTCKGSQYQYGIVGR